MAISFIEDNKLLIRLGIPKNKNPLINLASWVKLIVQSAIIRTIFKFTIRVMKINDQNHQDDDLKEL